MKVKLKMGEINSNVDMTPMIDIVFQLILFFLVSTTFVMLPGIKLNLPSSTTAESTGSSKSIVITADKEGALFFNEKETSMAALGNDLKAYDVGETPRDKFPVSLEADAEVTNGTIVKIFDVIRESGFCVINLRTTLE